MFLFFCMGRYFYICYGIDTSICAPLRVNGKKAQNNKYCILANINISIWVDYILSINQKSGAMECMEMQ